MAMVNERESSVCWVRDTEKIIKSNKIKNRKETYVKSFGIHLKRECNFGDHTTFRTHNYSTKNKKLGE